MSDFLFQILTFNKDNPLLFNSGTFWVLFILFLPIYGLLRNRKLSMMIFVSAFSIYFYYKSSGIFCLILIIRALVDFYLVKFMYLTVDKSVHKFILISSILLSAGVLVYFKYLNFVLLNLSDLLNTNFQPLDLLLPVGISFYTFQSISYIVDVYRNQTLPAKSFLEYFFYLSFFPSLVAGPIVRFGDFEPQIFSSKKITYTEVFSGFFLIMSGLVKKAIVADYLSQYNNSIFSTPDNYSGFECLIGVLGFSAQIFCDFSGYSDIAIGLARIMGFDLGVNFRSPYKALNITDFWRRWHVSLSTWLRDYIYIPLGGNRRGSIRTYVNIFITMVIGGLWHGAGWNFILWGSLHGVGLIVHKLKLQYANWRLECIVTKFLSWTFTFSFVALLWIVFRAETITDAVVIVSKIFCDFNIDIVMPFIANRLNLIVILVAAYIAIFLPHKFYKQLEFVYLNSNWLVKLIIFMCLIQSILQFSNSEIIPFIYFQF